MSAAATLAGLYAGALFVTCGWNKLFHPRRSAEMEMTMARVWSEDTKVMAWLVSMAQLCFGAWLVLGSLGGGIGGRVVVALSAFVLMTICAVGFFSTARFDMERQWRPEGTLDYIACVLWTSEVQLFALCAIALTGAVT